MAWACPMSNVPHAFCGSRPCQVGDITPIARHQIAISLIILLGDRDRCAPLWYIDLSILIQFDNKPLQFPASIMSNPTAAMALMPAQKPPPGLRSNFVDPPSQQGAIIAVCSVMVVLTLTFLCLRLYSSFVVTRSKGAEDCKRDSVELEDAADTMQISALSLRYVRNRDLKACHALMPGKDSFLYIYWVHLALYVTLAPILDANPGLNVRLVSYAARHMWDVPAVWFNEEYWKVGIIIPGFSMRS